MPLRVTAALSIAFFENSRRLPRLHRRLFSSTIASVSDATHGDASHEKHYNLKGSTSVTSRSGVTLRTSTGHTIQTDVPMSMGGKNEAAQPVETLLAALIGCTQTTALFVGRQLKPRIVIERMDFDLHAVRDERGALSLPIETSPCFPSRLQRVSGSIHVFATKGLSIDDNSLKLLKEQTEIRCPVANMFLASGCEMDIEWADGCTVVSSDKNNDSS